MDAISFEIRTNGALFWIVATWHSETWTVFHATRSRAKVRQALKRWEQTNER